MTERNRSARRRPVPSNHDEVLEFLQRLWALDHSLQSVSKRMRHRVGVTGPQRLVIRLVGKFPGISAGELAAFMELHPSTLTGVFRRLENQRLIRRDTAREDGRRAVFHLTPRGRRIYRMREFTVEDIVRRTLSRNPKEKVRSTGEVLESLAAALGRSLRRKTARQAASQSPRAPRRSHERH